MFLPKKIRWKWCSWDDFAMFSTMRARLWLGSAAAALVDSPQKYVDSTWGETCLLLLTVQTHRKVRCGQTGVWVASSHGLLFGGSDRGFVCRKFLWANSFWGLWRVSRGEYAPRYGRDQYVGVAYESRIHTPSWTVKISTEHWCWWSFGYETWHILNSGQQFWKRVFLCNLSWNSRFRRVNISWIPGTHVLLIINNFTETLCDVDDWIVHSVSLCLSPLSVYYLCHFVTFCTVKTMCVRGSVTVIFHILSIQKHWF